MSGRKELPRLHLVGSNEPSSSSGAAEATSKSDAATGDDFATAREFVQTAGGVIAKDYRDALDAIIRTAEKAKGLIGPDDPDEDNNEQSGMTCLVAEAGVSSHLQRILAEPSDHLGTDTPVLDDDLLREYGF